MIWLVTIAAAFVGLIALFRGCIPLVTMQSEQNRVSTFGTVVSWLAVIGCALTLSWSVPLLAGHHVVPDATDWTPPSPLSANAGAKFVNEHAGRVQYESSGKDWYYAGPISIPGHYVGLGNPATDARLCLYASSNGIVAQDEFHDGSRFHADTGPCHSFAPTKNVYKLDTDGSWTWSGPAAEGTDN